jgi:hypothetical protein
MRIAGILVVLVTAACAGRHAVPPGDTPQAAAAQDQAAATKPALPPAAPPVAEPAEKSAARPSAPPARSDVPAAKADAPAVKISPQARASPVPGKPPAPPPLDLKSLEQRLKDTDAIGVFTKLTLKNQVDDLLGRFRGYYQGQVKTTLGELRQPFDLLMLKVLSLLQDRDPSLANAILASREAIWGILTDPAKFQSLEEQG